MLNGGVVRLQLLLSLTETYFYSSYSLFSLAKKIWEEIPPSYQRKVEWTYLGLFKACFGFFGSSTTNADQADLPKEPLKNFPSRALTWLHGWESL